MAFFRFHNPLIFNQLHFPKKYCLHLFNHAIPLCNKGLHSPLAKVKAKRLKIGDARAMRAREGRKGSSSRRTPTKGALKEEKTRRVFTNSRRVFSQNSGVRFPLNVERLSKSCLNALGLPNRTLYRQPISTLPDPRPPTKWI